jgi:hypothetical protein
LAVIGISHVAIPPKGAESFWFLVVSKDGFASRSETIQLITMNKSLTTFFENGMSWCRFPVCSTEMLFEKLRENSL